ncbi:uncharacterized protein BDZ99DRAFT_484498 [Mytilinidion resinicola]|uniref:Zn(2)-C6 fungal-type domain-containing protein n=1 Tax=Mytilinidion resinicola TaxID=574789 RepID=A0A6A6ZA81_9PEZI|nr:uncharacterized protein BDZ99DRAFT_484498 [Mytilinidion resinicola]KAF2817738.1 hypothetical protein BDZ99DRAFT_484498 [Mytilinidion resinicola]
MLTDAHAEGAGRPHPTSEGMAPTRQYMTRQSVPPYEMQHHSNGYAVPSYQEPNNFTPASSLSPTKAADPKHVSFELLLPQSPQARARLPMRVNIFPHDTTDSIITTVKNFYGLYERRGVCFEDRHGVTLIARYENFAHNMVVYVRVTNEEVEPEEYSPAPRQSLSPRRPHLDEPFQMLPPSLNHQISRPASRTARQRSRSPQFGRGRRSASASTNPKRIRPSTKSRTGSSHGSFADPHGDAANGYSDSDGGNGSVTSSRRGRAEQLASAEISLDNIVEGGRRKRAKFDSSELPLFVPPQVPMTASLSSVSPQRRISSHNGASPFSYTNQQTFSYAHPLPSPQSYGHGDVSYLQGLSTPFSASNGQPHGHRSRTRGSAQYAPNRLLANGGIFPTPDPTVGSVISDEDVALQLMRLGDASNISAHGRTSTSTLDDALSGKAEAASSSEESDEGSDVGEGELPMLPYRANPIANGQEFDSGETSGEDYEDDRDESFKGGSDEIMLDADLQGSRPKTNGSISSKGRSSVSGSKHSKSGKPRGPSSKKIKVAGTAKAPISPTSLPPQSRKASSASLNFQHPLGVDEEDLSTKPRCQRCRKSKKGCDRQRPCQRCKDAGIGHDGCVSEDEGNGRKGRYGRHMGVPVKKTSDEMSVTDGAMSAPPSAYSPMSAISPDKSKKRKR